MGRSESRPPSAETAVAAAVSEGAPSSKDAPTLRPSDEVAVVPIVLEGHDLAGALDELRERNARLERRLLERGVELDEARRIARTAADDATRARTEAARTLATLAETKLHLGVLSRALEDSPLSVIVTNAQGDIEYVNSGASVVSGYEADELLGRTPSIFNSGVHPREFWEDLWSTLREGRRWVGEICNRKKDGTLHWEATSITPVALGSAVRFVAVREDITTRRRFIEELQDAKEAAEAAARAKGEFVANISHEIRTPLNAILGLSTLILKEGLPPKQETQLRQVHAAGSSLLAIVNEVLDFSKIEAGKLELSETDFDLEALVDELACLFERRAIEQKLEFVVEVLPDVPTFVRGDPLRLRQVLVNLLDNAFKFTTAGVIGLSAQRADDLNGSLSVRMVVTDTGVGMTPDAQARIFRPFIQADGSTTRKFGGTGLGLSISKRLVELMGGSLAVRSTPGEGSSFTFAVALKPCEERTSQSNLAIVGNAVRLLLVDDSAAARSATKRTLTGLFGPIDAVESGGAAFAALRLRDEAMPYDLVLLDWVMPGLSGADTLRLIKLGSSLRHVPRVVVLSGHDGSDAQQEAAGLGADGFLTKPVTVARLREIVTSLFGRAAPIATRAAPASRAPAPALAGMRLLLVEDNETNQEIALALLTDAGATVGLASNGREALQLLDASPTNFDVVLMDIQMPDLDGYEVTRRLRADPRFATLPIVALTAHAFDGDRRRSIAAGMNGHITKPLDAAALLEALGRFRRGGLTGPAKTGSRHRMRAVRETPGTFAMAGVDVDEAVQRLGGNRALYDRLIVGFVRDEATAAEKIESSLAAGQRDVAERIAHTLKGLAGGIGAGALAGAAAALEQGLRAGQPISALAPLVKRCQQGLARLLPVLGAALAGSVGGASTAPPPRRDQGPARAPAEILGTLARHVAACDAETCEFLARHRPVIAGKLPGEALARLESAIARYEFEEARAILDAQGIPSR